MGQHKVLNLSERNRYADEILKGLESKIKLQKTLARNKLSGKVNLKKINRELSRNGRLINTRLFNKEIRDSNKHDVILLIDYSGSMDNKIAGTDLIRMAEAKASAYVLGRVLNGLNVNFGIYAFCTNAYGDTETYLIGIKPFDKKLSNEDILDRLNRSGFHKEAQCNNDMIAYIKGAELLRHNGDANNKKLMIVISDGKPATYVPFETEIDDVTYITEATQKAIIEINESGIKTIGISLSQEADRFIQEAEYTQKVLINEETLKGNFAQDLINAYLNAVSGGLK